MPNGATHLRLWKAGIIPIAVGSVAIGLRGRGEEWWALSIPLIVGYGLGYLIDPDMDMKQNTRSKKIWRSHLLLLPLYPWWLVYSWVAGRFLGGHRSLYTHLPGLSTGLRMIWFIFPLALAIWLASALVSSTNSGLLSRNITQWLPQFLKMVLWMFIGLSVSDTIHSVADIIRKD